MSWIRGKTVVITGATEGIGQEAAVQLGQMGAHRGAAGVNFDDLGFEHGYELWGAYAQSKLANILFTRELAHRLDGTGVTANGLHPGTVATNIFAAGGIQPPSDMLPLAEGART